MTYQLKDYLNSINQSKKNILDGDPDAVKAYPPFIINKCLSGFTDSILFVNEMNIHWYLDKKLQYDFYLNSLKPRKRFTPWLKKDTVENIELVKQYYGYSHSKAVAALRILTNSELQQIKKLLDKGGAK
ncbi:DNA polymerase clamp loader subunit [Cyanophage S-RIM32]|uniref:DNA polymerase clamp loader subunit n=1 Tax=Cyanophage S-RIM32 TaxID=1278479 RepID=A0A127KME0_9CAUD|nr:clamp loader of DNA polymerase [Cyanophage S-RIM32]AMO43165.1 DNA polymerase clamp loader subunit [Cyanophage S-RIM32]